MQHVYANPTNEMSLVNPPFFSTVSSLGIGVGLWNTSAIFQKAVATGSYFISGLP